MSIEDSDRDSIPPSMQEEVCGEFSLYGEGELRAALERARVVGVLDAWASRHSRAWTLVELNEDGAQCVGRVDEGARGTREHFRKTAHTPDAARAAAAKAIENGEV